MKTKNKALAVISALMLCIVLVSGLFPVKVSAAEAKPLSDLEQYYLSGGTGDMTGVKIKEYDDKISSVKYPEYAGTVGSYSSNNDTRHYAYYDLTDKISRFKLACYSIYYYRFRYQNETDTEEKEFYYLYNFGTVNSGDYVNNERHIIQIIYSFSPISFELNDNKYILRSDSEIYVSFYIIATSGTTVSYLYNRDLSPSVSDTYSEKYFYYNTSCTDFYKNSFVYINQKQASINWEEIYSNCDLEINGHNFRNEPFQNLKSQIDVKLTPEFGFDMDRVFDKNTGQNDYFKFEITNNSDVAIQWCAYIVSSEYEDNENGIDNVDETRYLVPSYENCRWLYITDEIYYSSTVKKEKKYLGLKTETKLCANRKTGNFYFHLLKPGQTLTDYIYWENVNIQPLKSYDIRFNCLPIENLAYPSDMFSSRYFVDTVGSILGTDFEKQEDFDEYVIDDSLYTEIYRCSFSVLDIPDFTTTVRGGNSVGNGGFSDAEKLKDNFETSMDLSDGKISINSNYSDNPLLLNDVNIDISNVSLEDVKGYITYSTNFFNLIKSVLAVFPVWIWVLICFGLTALIVIAIVKALL
ncbi:MAG: hypothetical protein NC320_12470 [Clostridium sp.]|nr:hypothetical protein [Clostridium sp.]